jgi:sugar lactone lactonase YvrE
VKEYEAATLFEPHYELGECCRWDEVREELSWVDVPAGTFFRASVDTSVELVRSYQVEGYLSAVAPFTERSEGWVIAMNQSIAHLDESGTVHELARPEERNAPLVRMNDGACDPWGSFLVGSMALDMARGRGSFYRMDSERRIDTLFSHVTVSNGVAWSPDARTMYYVDSGPGTIDAFSVDATGALGERARFLRFEASHEGTPDGLCVDVEGCLWVAFWDGGEVRRFSPKGEQLARVTLPVSRPTSCALGGASGMRLFITTAREGLNEEQLAQQPDAGRLFVVDVAVRGLPTNGFGRA